MTTTDTDTISDTTTDPNGPRPAAGKLAALRLTAQGHHVHFVAGDHARCISEHCGDVPPILDGTTA